MAFGLLLAIAHEQALAAAATSLPKSEEELKAKVYSWLLSHGQAGGIVLGVVVVGVVFLTQAQNIQATISMLSQFLGHVLGHGRKPPEPQPPPVEPNQPIHITIQQPPPPPDSRSTPAVAGALTNLPPDRPGFVARAAELQQLATDLAPEAAQVVIHGLPGVGKTTLARHYAHGANANYPGGVWWLDASKGFGPMVLEAVTELEARIGLPKEKGLNLEARLRRCFQSWPGEAQKPVLMVVDNLPPPPEGLEVMRQLTAGLPGRFRRLLTQRDLPPSSTEALRLSVLASDEALDLLKARSGQSGRLRIAREEEQARELVEEVGRLPLALVLLGGRLDRVPSLKVADLRQDLAGFALQASAFTEKNAAFLGEQGMVATLMNSWDALGPKGMELARLLSLTLAAPIPWELIESCSPPESEEVVSGQWEDALAELVGANLLESLAGERPLYALHPLVREFFSSQRQGWEIEPHWRGQMATTAHALVSHFQGKDLVIAVEYLRQASHLEPTDHNTAFSLGYGLMHLGDVREARDVFDRIQCSSEAVKDYLALAGALCGIGDMLKAQGEASGALEAYQKSLSNLKVLAKHDPENIQCQRNIAVCREKMGDVLTIQGEISAAFDAYQENLLIIDGLTRLDPGNWHLQCDLSNCHDRIGNILRTQGKNLDALNAYKLSLVIREGLTRCHPTNTQWQFDLSVSYCKIGEEFQREGNATAAMSAYRKCQVISEALAKRDPANTQWQRGLSISHVKIGDVLISQGDWPGALVALRAGLAIAEALAKCDPANTEWKRDLSVSHIKIGDVLVSQGDDAGALSAYQESLLIIDSLTRLDPGNTQWQRDLSVSHERIGNVLVALGDGPRALAAYQEGHKIAERLTQRNPENTQWQRDLSISHDRIGDVLMGEGDDSGALASYQAGLTIAEGLEVRNPANTQWHVDVATSCCKLGTLEGLLPVTTRRVHLQRGLAILLSLKQAGRLGADQDYTGWFVEQIQQLDAGK